MCKAQIGANQNNQIISKSAIWKMALGSGFSFFVTFFVLGKMKESKPLPGKGSWLADPFSRAGFLDLKTRR